MLTRPDGKQPAGVAYASDQDLLFLRTCCIMAAAQKRES